MTTNAATELAEEAELVRQALMDGVVRMEMGIVVLVTGDHSIVVAQDEDDIGELGELLVAVQTQTSLFNHGEDQLAGELVIVGTSPLFSKTLLKAL